MATAASVVMSPPLTAPAAVSTALAAYSPSSTPPSKHWLHTVSTAPFCHAFWMRGGSAPCSSGMLPAPKVSSTMPRSRRVMMGSNRSNWMPGNTFSTPMGTLSKGASAAGPRGAGRRRAAAS